MLPEPAAVAGDEAMDAAGDAAADGDDDDAADEPCVALAAGVGLAALPPLPHAVSVTRLSVARAIIQGRLTGFEMTSPRSALSGQPTLHLT